MTAKGKCVFVVDDKVANVVLVIHPGSDAPMLVDTMKFLLEMLKSDACCSVECFFCYKQPISYRTPILMKDMRGGMGICIVRGNIEKRRWVCKVLVNW